MCVDEADMRIKNMQHITTMEFYLAMKKGEILTFSGKMDSAENHYGK